jgi:hypothetical protein
MHHDASRDAPPTSFIKSHAKDKHRGQPRPCFAGISWRHVRQGSMEVTQRKKSSSGRSKNASEEVDENVWCNPVELAVMKQQSKHVLGKSHIQLFVRVL